jgi:predicted amidohydrolase
MTRKKYCGTAAKAGGNGENKPRPKVMGVPCLLEICFDRQLPEPARALTLGGADLIACPSYGGWGDWNTRVMQVRAYENQAYVVFTHPEQSLIIDRDGDLLDECREDEIALHELNLSGVNKTRQSITQRRPETYRKISARASGDISMQDQD